MVTRVPDALRGAALATFTGLWEIAALIAPPLLGLLADARGDAAMFAAVAVGTLVILVAWAVAEHRAPTQH